MSILLTLTKFTNHIRNIIDTNVIDIQYFHNMALPCTIWIHKRTSHNVKLSKTTTPTPMAQQPVVGKGYPGFTIILRHTKLLWTQRPLRNNTQHSQQTDISTSRAEFEPTSQASERPEIHALDRTVTGIVAKPPGVTTYLTMACESSNFDAVIWYSVQLTCESVMNHRIPPSVLLKPFTAISLISVAYPGILFGGGGSKNSVEDREKGKAGGVAP